jgi:hypothetical protein
MRIPHYPVKRSMHTQQATSEIRRVPLPVGPFKEDLNFSRRVLKLVSLVRVIVRKVVLKNE